MTDLLIQMGITIILEVTRQKDGKLLERLRPALLKVRNAINACYPGV